MSGSSTPAQPARAPQLKLALWLGAAGVLATLLLFPYLLAMMPLKFAMLRQPWWILMLLQSAQAGVLCLLLGWLGLVLGARHGLDAPWLRAWVYHQPRDPVSRQHWLLAVVLGVTSALLVIAVSLLSPHPAAAATDRSLNWVWCGALASFYGGIVEELECRLFLSACSSGCWRYSTVGRCDHGCLSLRSCWLRCYLAWATCPRRLPPA